MARVRATCSSSRVGGKRKRLSVRAVCASQHAPLCACSLFLLELRDLTLLSLSPKSCGRDLHSQLCPHIMVCMDVRSMLPNTNYQQGTLPLPATPSPTACGSGVPPGRRAPYSEPKLWLYHRVQRTACNHNARMSSTQAHPALTQPLDPAVTSR